MRPRNKAILWAAALGVVGMLYVFSREPSRPSVIDNCAAKGIDPEQMVEGYCLVGHEFVTFDLAITNHTDRPQSVGESQLAIPGTWGEDTTVERGYEPHSFLSRPTPIAPGETAHGTVIFQMSTAAIEDLAKEGNLDIDNFGPDSEYDPEEVFSQPEVGVIRTYGPR
jgi:hypothetical protein